jgi:hypothetical protein
MSYVLQLYRKEEVLEAQLAQQSQAILWTPLR